MFFWRRRCLIRLERTAIEKSTWTESPEQPAVRDGLRGEPTLDVIPEHDQGPGGRVRGRLAQLGHGPQRVQASPP